MSSTAQNLASSRIAALLDENSFVEIGAAVTARATDFNMNNTDTPSDGVVTGYGVINDSLVLYIARMLPYSEVPWVRCMPRKLPESMTWQ